jgi:Protein of unknown function (DUF2457)
MANHQQDNNRRQSAIQNLLNMFHLSNTPTVPLNSEEEVGGDVDEPPDEPLSPLRLNHTATQAQTKPYIKSLPPAMDRKESLLTRALMTSPTADVPSPLASPVPGVLSRASTFSNASMPSTAELTDDADDTSPARSASPSPPLPSTQFHQLQPSNHTTLPLPKISLVSNQLQSKPADSDSQESKIEANLGRKRCITFACAGKPAAQEQPPIKDEKKEPAQPPKRRCMITFACPARPAQSSDQTSEPSNSRRESGSSSPDVTAPSTKEPEKIDNHVATQSKETSNNSEDKQQGQPASPTPLKNSDAALPEASPFHEFASSHEQQDAWVNEPIDRQRKLTLTDCMKKENAIRKIGEEAEEEAEQEEREEEELEEENEDGANEDDFAPSDDGNESDNEAGFAESDDDSDAESDDQFWVPTSTTAATSVEHVSPIRLTGARRQSGSSMDSFSDHRLNRKPTTDSIDIKYSKHRRPSKNHHLRANTPELPDSTDFVCGTLDEDRPLEAAYISCREQKKREKHIPIPQDIDPSFPTTDPEDLDEEDDEDLEVQEDHLWLKDQLEGFDDDRKRPHGNRPGRKSTLRSPRRVHSPPPKHGIHRSPPPPRHTTRRSPPAPKRRLFGHSPKRLHSPPPPMKLRSPPGTRRSSPTDMSPATLQPPGLIIGRLAQRPHMSGTASLPRTPNPFFHNYHARTQQNDRVAFGAIIPGGEKHIRGPVDIVIGLEKKRQKRKEKFWRQHCRRAAKEQAERKAVPGKGAERMRELGLECAERTRGYGLGQQPALVISL